MLIRNADINFGTRADLRIADGVVTEIGALLASTADEIVIDAGGCALLPGLHDHHTHLLAFAASLDSVACGPPDVACERELSEALQARQAASPGAWIRGVGYHPSVAGEIDRTWLDRVVPASPTRIQHRSGRLWIMNTKALDLVTPNGAPTPLEMIDGQLTGRLYDADNWLRDRIGTITPPLDRASEFLLSRGVTGLTDTSPGNGPAELDLLQRAQAAGDLAQSVMMMGSATLNGVADRPSLAVGPTKIHLREAGLPAMDEIAGLISNSHRVGRKVAIHCTALAELVFALGAFDEAGALPGDRIEHAAVAPPEFLPLLAERRLTVVTQPNFVLERGDLYLREVDPVDRPWLYRLRGFLAAGIPLAGGTDAPFGDPDPWIAMQAAVTRRTRAGEPLGLDEALTPEEAVGLFLGEGGDPGGHRRSIRPGIAADLCLIDRSWPEARKDLTKVRVAQTIRAGQVVWPPNRPVRRPVPIPAPWQR